MDVIGVGTDIADCAQMRTKIDRSGEPFLERVFTAAEIAYCRSYPADPVARFCGRWAAKEAVLKALGTGWSGGIAWTDVEIVNEASGRPRVRLAGGAAEHARRLGVEQWQVSLSHTRCYATGFAIALGHPK